jgi:hypothetical protein
VIGWNFNLSVFLLLMLRVSSYIKIEKYNISAVYFINDCRLYKCMQCMINIVNVFLNVYFWHMFSFGESGLFMFDFNKDLLT